jgi:DNA-binding MarR family transcriptional regulator
METPLETTLWETRRLFRALTLAADELLSPLGINASHRALLEFLAREGAPISLSALARKRSVTRQHIHQTLAHLPNSEWIVREGDPEDARSVLLSLSRSGRAFWKKVRAADRSLLRCLERDLDPVALRACAQTLKNVRARLRNVVPDKP